MRRNYVIRIILLSIVGGSADAIAYMRYGVFVGAMTGNTVLIGIDLIGVNFGKAAYHVAIVAIFLAAAVLSGAVKLTRIRRFVMLTSASILLGTSELINDHWAAAVSAAALAIQNTIMRQASFFAVNTAFVTGNMVRLGTDISRLANKSQEAGLLAVALGFYAMGAIAGAAAEKLVSHGMWMPAAVCLLTAILPEDKR